MDPNLVEKAIGFHGLPLQKIWEGERSESELVQLGISNPDFSVYQSRQKSLTFQDRAKRFKLHQFLSKKADFLYDRALCDTPAKSRTDPRRVPGDFQQYEPFVMPPIDVYIDVDTNEKVAQYLETTVPGDVVYGLVLNRSPQGIIFKVLYSTGNNCCFVNSSAIKAYVSSSYLVPVVDRLGNPRVFAPNDLVCCEVASVQPDARKLVCTMHRTLLSRAPASVEYGLISAEDLPAAYNLASVKEPKPYDYHLKKTLSFNDPREVGNLMRELCLDEDEFYTNMSSLKGKFASQEYAGELRNAQASKWAFRSVAEGIEHFKEGRHSEAFQCLNKALSIDSRNVEGLVARGALYANSGSFKKAVDDFEMALKINSSHANARKYLGETLVALGRSYEDDNRLEDARKAYQDCLAIIPQHEEAQNSLEFLKTKTSFNKQIVAPGELELPALNIPKLPERKLQQQEADTSAGRGGSGDGPSGGSGPSRLAGGRAGAGGGGNNLKRDGSESSRKDKKAGGSRDKKDKKKRHKKTAAAAAQTSSSESNSSNSSESSESSSESDNSNSSSESSSSSDSSRSSRAKKRSSKRTKGDPKKQKSLSPLSKRMGVGMGNDVRGGGVGEGSFSFGNQAPAAAAYHHHPQAHAPDEYELKVRKFLDMPRDEDDYEEKVRRFVAEAAKYQKERKAQDEKSKKKKKKDEKKAKKESKKKRKSEEKKKSKKGGKDKDDDPLNNDKLKEALKIFENFPVLDELGSKLSEFYSKGGSAGPSGLSSVMSSLLSKGAASKKEAKASKADAEAKKASEGKEKDGKWRMMFNKDERTAAAKESASTSKSFVPKQYAFSNDSDEDSSSMGVFQMQQHQQQLQQKSRRRASPEKTTTKPSVSQMAPVKSGPVVLDKFGNFRLANADDASKPPEPSGPPRASRSRSRGRRYGSSSRSRSGSPRNRSRSGSFNRFSRSRSRSSSQSYSRSRSRSRSFERNRRFERRDYRGRGNFHYRPYNNRYHHRGGNFNFNRRGGYRDFRGGYREYRPYNNYNRQYNNNFRQYRGGGNNGGGNRFQRSYSRSTSKSPDRTGDDRRRNDRDRSSERHSSHKRDKSMEKERDRSVEIVEEKIPTSTLQDELEGRWGGKESRSHDPPPPGAEDSSQDDVDRIHKEMLKKAVEN